MTALNLLYVLVGGAFGSLCRYLVMVLSSRVATTDFPYGTLTVNVLGSFLMGVWVALIAYVMPAKARDLHLLFAVGMLGGFTTFSAFAMDIFLLADRGLLMQMAIYIASSIALSVLALLSGMYIVRLVF